MKKIKAKKKRFNSRLEFKKWDDGKYPYDMASCGFCATQHVYTALDVDGYFSCPSDMREEAKKLFVSQPSETERITKKQARIIRAFRRKWASHYKG